MDYEKIIHDCEERLRQLREITPDKNRKRKCPDMRFILQK